MVLVSNDPSSAELPIIQHCEPVEASDLWEPAASLGLENIREAAASNSSVCHWEGAVNAVLSRSPIPPLLGVGINLSWEYPVPREIRLGRYLFFLEHG